MANENCLTGMACPECGSLGPYDIAGTALFEVHDDGTEDFESVEWSADSYCRCRKCGLAATVGYFSWLKHGGCVMNKFPRYITPGPRRPSRVVSRPEWHLSGRATCWGLLAAALSWLVFLALLWGLGLVSITPAAPTIPAWPCCP